MSIEDSRNPTDHDAEDGRLQRAPTKDARWRRKPSWLFGLVAVAAAVGLVIWFVMMSATDAAIATEQHRTFTVDTEYDKFRQILVRTDSTRAIVEHYGMKVLDEETKAVELDLSKEDRPIRNALLGRSKTEVSAVKNFTVQLNNTELNIDRLPLTQTAEIHANQIDVITTAPNATGKLKSYRTHLVAKPVGSQTQVELQTDVEIEVRVPLWFRSYAQSRVDSEVAKSVEEQEAAIHSLTDKYASTPIIIPKIKR